MPSEAELTKRKYPRVCPTGYCMGYGLYDTEFKTAMSKKGAEMNFKTKACPHCGANCNPNGKT